MRPAHVHNLRGNKAERSPHRLFIWDTETNPLAEERREIHQLRCWAAEAVQRHDRRPKQPALVARQGNMHEDLVGFLEESCRSTETMWAFAHNQTFDLGATRLPLRLIRRGWTITAHALASPSPWVRLQRRSHRLVLVDSSSWLPGPLATIGDQVGIEKPDLPDQDADEEDWAYRCRTDVAILRHAICELLDWWDRKRMGAWSITGPQTGFNAMRHRPTPHTVVIDPEPAAREFERRAIMAGRRECWRVGRLRWGDFRELDFRTAHATIAARCPLPKRRSVHFERLALDDWRLTSDRWAPIAWAEIRTNTPRYPLAIGGRLFYPIGHFRTILCGPELREALCRRELLSVGPGYVYQLGQHMGEWGRWVIDQLGREDPDTPAVGRTAIKGWSRTVPGKWASRTSRTLHEGVSATQGWALEHGRHHPSGAPVAVLDMAQQRTVLLQDQESDDSFPAVLAWIQSEVRVRLGRLIDAIGADAMVSCNTDGLICEGEWVHAVRRTQQSLLPLVAREKNRYSSLDVLSPQHVVHDGKRRLSGVPASADEVEPHRYQWLTWPRMARQIAINDPRGYVRERRTMDLSRVPVNRWVLAEGRCLPVTAALDASGETYLEPFEPYALSVNLSRLREPQHPVLMAALERQGE